MFATKDCHRHTHKQTLIDWLANGSGDNVAVSSSFLLLLLLLPSLFNLGSISFHLPCHLAGPN